MKEVKVKCFTFMCEELNRELAVHADIDLDNETSISDKATGLRLTNSSIPFKNIKMDHISLALNNFIKKYTVEGIKEELRKHEADEEV